MNDTNQGGVNNLAALIRKTQYFTFACAKDPNLWKYEGEQARTYKIKTEDIIQTYKNSGATVLVMDENVRPVERRIYL